MSARLIEWTARIAGWKRAAAALGSGAIAALALPPLHFLPALPVAFSLLLLMLGAADRRRSAFAIGFCFGFGYYALSLYWIGFALLVDAARFAWLLPFAVFGIAGALALFVAAGTLPAWALLRRKGGMVAGALMLAAGWSLAEWVRGFAFTGFPWNPLASVWGFHAAMLQPASLVGSFGLAVPTVFLACLPAVWLATRGGMRTLSMVGGALILAAWTGFGAWRLADSPTSFVDGVGLRLVQANIDQRDKWRRDLRVPNLTRLLALSADDRPDWVTHVIWPETAATFFLSENPEVVRAIASVAPEGGAVLTGAPRIGGRSADGGAIYHNSLVAITGDSRIAASYDKTHLVPFGEYVPLRDWLPLERIVAGRGDFTPGPGLETLRVSGLPAFSALICYEAIFPGAAVDSDDRPDWILNISNDAWFGVSAGPHQHLAAARLRAIEEGLPVVRATNTGISALFDPVGRELQRLDLDRRGVLDLRLPNPKASPTFFSWCGNAVSVVLAILSGLIALLVMNGVRRGERTA